jgi:hypothetical protein
MNKNIKRNTNLLMIIGVILVVSSVIGSAQTFISSTNVLEIDGSGVGGVGGAIPSTLFTSGPFNAGVLNWYHVSAASFSSVGSNDTVVLFQVNIVNELTAAQEATLVSFVTGGGKLIIWDSDAGATTVTPNDYSWLPAALNFNTSVPGQLGASGGILNITEENDLSSNISSNPKFINTTRLVNFTDAVGDANVVKTNGTDWCQDMFAQNKATPPQSGPGHMYSRLGGSAVNGFIVYSALDWDYASFSGIGGDELKKMMQFELEVNHTSDLPCKVPVVAPEGSISGMKFNDLNGNGINDAEPGLVGWTITLTNESGGVVTNVTDASGNYSFTGLADGNYTVGEVLQSGWIQTAPQPVPPGTYTVNLSAGENVIGKDFGNIKTPIASCIETVNPAGKNVPPAGSTTLPGSKGGQNEDGFYELQANNPLAEIFVKDIVSGTIFPLLGPGFSPGTKIKYTQAPGATPSIKNIGGPNSAVAWHITGTGDAAVYAVVGIVKGSEVVCKVPPPPK